jgi:hypothetical protein
VLADRIQPLVAALGRRRVHDAYRGLSERRRAIHANHGFTSAQVLSGNVGYLKIAEFMEPQASLETATAAMRFVASTRALLSSEKFVVGRV